MRPRRRVSVARAGSGSSVSHGSRYRAVPGRAANTNGRGNACTAPLRPCQPVPKAPWGTPVSECSRSAPWLPADTTAKEHREEQPATLASSNRSPSPRMQKQCGIGAIIPPAKAGVLLSRHRSAVSPCRFQASEIVAGPERSRWRRRRKSAVTSRWQGRHRVRRLPRSHWPPPSATGST